MAIFGNADCDVIEVTRIVLSLLLLFEVLQLADDAAQGAGEALPAELVFFGITSDGVKVMLFKVDYSLEEVFLDDFIKGDTLFACTPIAVRICNR